MFHLWQKIQGQGYWPTIFRRVNVSFRRFRRKEGLTFLTFIAISSFFWIFQTAREVSTADFTVNIIIDDQPQDMVFTTLVPQQLRLSLTDINYKLIQYDNTFDLHINCERYADALGYFRIPAAELQSLISTLLMSSTHIQSVSPSVIDARFAQTEGRKFPVRIIGTLLPAPNHRLHEIKIEPDSVMVHAPNSVLDTLKYVFADGGNRFDLQDTLTEELTLELPIGVKATPSHVTRTVPVVEYVEKVFDQIPIQVTDSIPGQRLVVFPYAATVRCLVDLSLYRDITPDMFSVTVSQAQCAEADGRHGYLPVTVTYRGPADEVDNITVSPQQAEYLQER